MKPFLEICRKLGADCEAVSHLVEKVWSQQRELLLLATACKEPDQEGLQGAFAGIAGTVREIGAAVRRTPMENNVKTIFEGVQSLSWPLVKPAPVDFMTSYIDGADMWSNRIRKEFKGVNEDQISFCVLFKKLMTELRAFVKEFHTTGLLWNNATGRSIQEVTQSSSSSSSSAPAQPATSTSSSSSSSKGDVTQSLFAALKQEESVTAGLRKVTKEQQTWRAEYKAGGGGDGATTSTKSGGGGNASAATSANKSSVATGAAKVELQGGSKWAVDYYTAPLTITTTDIKQTVYLYKCDSASITVVGKCKSIVLDGCRRVTLTFHDDLISGLEVGNSQSSKVICLGKVPSVAIDKSDGVHLTLGKQSLDVELVCSKSSEMNVAFPDPDNDEEMLERPIPEQYVHTIDHKSVTARVSDLYTH